MTTSEGNAEQLLKLYDQLQGQPPADAPPALKALFDDISRSQEEAVRKNIDSQGTQIIFPVPGFVVKTVDADGKKVFINVCSSDKISPPSSWEGGVMPDSVRQALQNLDDIKSEEDVQALRVPLSLSDQRSEPDKAGISCIVFDCVFAEEVLKEARQYRPMKVFVIECCLGWIQHKCKLKLDSKFKLPKLTYKGDTIHEHWIKKEAKQLVTEVKDKAKEDLPSVPLLSKPVKAKPKMPCAAHKQTTTQLIGIQYDGKPCQTVRVFLRVTSQSLLHFPALIKVDLDSMQFCLDKENPVDIPLNVYVRPETCQYTLVGDSLEVQVAYLSTTEILELAKDRKPLQFGEVRLKSQGMLHELD